MTGSGFKAEELAHPKSTMVMDKLLGTGYNGTMKTLEDIS